MEDQVGRPERGILEKGLRIARLDTGMTQHGLARRAGLNQSTISRLESGQLKGLRYSTLVRILAALGVRDVRFRVRPRGLYAELIARYAHDGHHLKGVSSGAEGDAGTDDGLDGNLAAGADDAVDSDLTAGADDGLRSDPDEGAVGVGLGVGLGLGVSRPRGQSPS